MLKIKYATAKSIIAKARRLRNKKDKSENKKECLYEPIENRVPKWTIVSLSFGVLMN
jgi:ribosomal protein S7